MTLCLTDPGIDESLHSAEQVSAMVVVASRDDYRQVRLLIQHSKLDDTCKTVWHGLATEHLPLRRGCRKLASRRTGLPIGGCEGHLGKRLVTQSPRAHILPDEWKAVSPQKCRQNKVAFVGIEEDPFKCAIHPARIVRKHSGKVNQCGAPSPAIRSAPAASSVKARPG